MQAHRRQENCHDCPRLPSPGPAPMWLQNPCLLVQLPHYPPPTLACSLPGILLHTSTKGKLRPCQLIDTWVEGARQELVGAELRQPPGLKALPRASWQSFQGDCGTFPNLCSAPRGSPVSLDIPSRTPGGPHLSSIPWASPLRGPRSGGNKSRGVEDPPEWSPGGQ